MIRVGRFVSPALRARYQNHRSILASCAGHIYDRVEIQLASSDLDARVLAWITCEVLPRLADQSCQLDITVTP